MMILALKKFLRAVMISNKNDISVGSVIRIKSFKNLQTKIENWIFNNIFLTRVKDYTTKIKIDNKRL